MSEGFRRIRIVVDAVLGLGLVALAGVAYGQHSDLEALRAEVAELRAAPTPTAETGRKGWRDRVAARRANRSATSAAPAASAGPRRTPVRPASDDERPDPGRGGSFDDFAQSDDPEVREKLRDVIAEERQLMRQERWQKRLERREQSIFERVDTLASTASLDEDKTTGIKDMLQVELLEISDLMQKAREDFSYREARAKAEEIRADTDKQARALLDEGEYAEYAKMREEDRQNWGARGGRRGDGGGRPSTATTKH